MSNKVPQIRFNGYSDAWVQRKFKNFISKSGPRNKNGEFTEAYSVSNTLGLVKQSDQFDGSRLDSLDKKDYKIVQPDEFAYNPARINVGSIAFNNLNKPVIVSSLYVIVKMSDNLNDQFVLQWLKSPEFNFEVIRNTEGSVREYLFYENFANVRFPYTPNYDEQVKIGALLGKLDDLIADNQRKLDLLKEQKKGYLQKMFPKNGAKVPELRFAGFADDWEERKLQEVLRERNNQQPQSMEYPLVSFTVENGVTPKTDRYEREQLVVGDKSSKKYKVTVLNDIVYNPANLKFGAISRNKYGNAVFSPIYITFVVNNDVTTPEFIEMFVTRNDFIKRALKYQQGTVYERQSVSPADLLSMVLYLPGKAEQEKIGSFFAQLDNTIALHQRKLDLLKEQKKGFLQKMFIQGL